MNLVHKSDKEIAIIYNERKKIGLKKSQNKTLKDEPERQQINLCLTTVRTISWIEESYACPEKIVSALLKFGLCNSR